MIFLIRFIIVMIYCPLVCILGSIYCLLINPRCPKHTARFGRMFGYLAPIFGLKVETRFPNGIEDFGNAIYIANHQNNYDMITASNIVIPPIVTIGKKSLLWIPFFGQLYWLTGNILIDRKNHIRAYDTINKIVNQFKNSRISLWVFPEGTRSNSEKLLPFKTGAFHIAIEACVPIIPICISNTLNKVNLNRLHNGLVIVEMMSPVDTSQYKKNQVHDLSNYCRNLMIKKIDELNEEVRNREYISNT